MKRKKLTPQDYALSFWGTAVVCSFAVQFVRFLLGAPSATETYCAQWAEIIGAVIAVAATIISAAISAEDAEDLEEAQQDEWMRKRQAKKREERIKYRQQRQQLAGEERQVRLNERILQEQEKERERQRKDIEKEEKLAHAENIAGIMVPKQQQEAVREHRVQTWGV